MAKHYEKNTAVKWKWGTGFGRGQVIEKFTDNVTRKIKDTEVTREASEEQPAYLIKQDDGDEVLKSDSEIEQDN